MSCRPGVGRPHQRPPTRRPDHAPHHDHAGFTETISFAVDCADQEEVDRYWTALTADGGRESMCGWLVDRFGLSWQVVPVRLYELMADPDPVRAQAAATAMLQMQRIVVTDLEAAADAAT